MLGKFYEPMFILFISGSGSIIVQGVKLPLEMLADSNSDYSVSDPTFC